MSNSSTIFYRLSGKVGHFFDHIYNLFAGLAAIIIVAMVGVLFYEVFMRYVMHKPPAWAWEICECMVYLIAFFGAAWLLKKDGHVSVDIIYSRLSPGIKRVVTIISSTIGMIICLLITWAGIWITIDHFSAGITIPGYLNLPKAPFLLVIPLSTFLLSIQFLRQAFGHLAGHRKQ